MIKLLLVVFPKLLFCEKHVCRCYCLWNLVSLAILPKHTMLIVGGHQFLVWEQEKQFPFKLSLAWDADSTSSGYGRTDSLAVSKLHRMHFSWFYRLVKQFATLTLSALLLRYVLLVVRSSQSSLVFEWPMLLESRPFTVFPRSWQSLHRRHHCGGTQRCGRQMHSVTWDRISTNPSTLRPDEVLRLDLMYTDAHPDVKKRMMNYELSGVSSGCLWRTYSPKVIDEKVRCNAFLK